MTPVKLTGLLFLLCTTACETKFMGELNAYRKTTFAPKQHTRTHNINTYIDSLHINRNNIHVRIYKSAYRLHLVYDTCTVKSYPVVFGFNAVDDKLKQGDGCTPEGVFGIRAKYPHASWSKFIWIDYPNKSSWEKHNQAKKEGWLHKTASIGGEVGIHGVPKGFDYMIDERENWTLGCISLKNRDVDELYAALGEKSKIYIYK